MDINMTPSLLFNSALVLLLLALPIHTLPLAPSSSSSSSTSSLSSLASGTQHTEDLLSRAVAITKRAAYLYPHSREVQQQPTSIPPFHLLHLIRLVLYEHGMDSNEVDSVISELIPRIGSNRPSGSGMKRGFNRFNRISVQPRVSPFGTKIVPNRNNGNNGGTLFRYGRSVL